VRQNYLGICYCDLSELLGTESIVMSCMGVIIHNKQSCVTMVLINLLNPTGYGMHQQVEYFKNFKLCPHCIYVFCISLRTNSDVYHLQHKLIGFYNRDKKCLQRGTDWTFK
jgi:hypothetical protein